VVALLVENWKQAKVPKTPLVGANYFNYRIDVLIQIVVNILHHE